MKRHPTRKTMDKFMQLLRDGTSFSSRGKLLLLKAAKLVQKAGQTNTDFNWKQDHLSDSGWALVIKGQRLLEDARKLCPSVFSFLVPPEKSS